MTSAGQFQQLQRNPLHQSLNGLAVKNVDRYQRSWKLDVGFQKLQKRISERIKRESTLPPITFGTARNVHTSYNRKTTNAQSNALRTSQTQNTSRDKHKQVFTPKSKSEHSYSINLYRRSNNGTTRLANGRLKRTSGRRLTSSIPYSSSFSLEEEDTSSSQQTNNTVRAPALSMADINKLNRHFGDTSEEENEERITKWVRDCTDVYNCCAALPYQHKETVSFSKFKPKPPNTPRNRNVTNTRIERSKTTL